MTDVARKPEAPDMWPKSWHALNPEPPGSEPGPGFSAFLARDPDTGEALPMPVLLASCPCPFKGLRCWDCSMIAIAPPPFTATRLGWTLATIRRVWFALVLRINPPED